MDMKILYTTLTDTGLLTAKYQVWMMFSHPVGSTVQRQKA